MKLLLNLTPRTFHVKNKKPKAIRYSFTKQQTAHMSTLFEDHPMPSADLLKSLSEELGASAHSIKIWFQNRRAKLRNLEESHKESGKSVKLNVRFQEDETEKVVVKTLDQSYVKQVLNQDDTLPYAIKHIPLIKKESLSRAESDLPKPIQVPNPSPIGSPVCKPVINFDSITNESFNLPNSPKSNLSFNTIDSPLTWWDSSNKNEMKSPYIKETNSLSNNEINSPSNNEMDSYNNNELNSSIISEVSPLLNLNYLYYPMLFGDANALSVSASNNQLFNQPLIDTTNYLYGFNPYPQTNPPTPLSNNDLNASSSGCAGGLFTYQDFGLDDSFKNSP